MESGRIFILSGPSGSGKSSLIDRLLADPTVDLQVAPSATTRPPRPDDQHLKQYIYMTLDDFIKARDVGDFLESAEVSGNWYGTPQAPVMELLAEGHSVLLEIDVQGGLAIKKIFPDIVLVFLKANSIDVYERRIRMRGGNSEDEIAQRLQVALNELEQADKYDYQLVNDELDRVVEEFKSIIHRSGGPSSA